MYTVKEDIFVGQKIRLFRPKRFVWNLISEFEIDKKKKEN